jgi:hypothetical protein
VWLIGQINVKIEHWHVIANPLVPRRSRFPILGGHLCALMPLTLESCVEILAEILAKIAETMTLGHVICVVCH